MGRARNTQRRSLDTKTFESVELIPLNSAVLCEDCQMISKARNDHCLSCGSHSILSLANVLGSQFPSTRRHQSHSVRGEEGNFQGVSQLRSLPEPGNG
jgi:hypothetical protein